MSIRATDSTNASYTKSMALTVVGTSPQLLGINTGAPLDDANVGDRYTAGFSTCCGGVGGAVTWSATGLPPGMSIRFGDGVISSNYAVGSAEVYGIPQTAGSWTLQLTASAGGQSVTSNFPLTVGILNVQGVQNGTLGVSYNQPIRILGGASPYSAALAPGSALLPLGIALTATPPALAGNSPGENGFFSPYVTFTDNAGKTLTKHIYFSINNVAGSTGVSLNNGQDLGSVLINSNYSFTFNGSGTSPFTWLHTGGTLPPGLTLSTGGVLSGTVNTAGTYLFTLKMTDNTSKTALRQFKLVVSGLNVTTASPLPFGNVNSVYTIAALVATGGSGTQTWVVAPGSALPPGMSLSGAGVLGGTPTSTGNYNFTINVSDTSANFGTRQFSLSVYAAGSAPPIVISTSANLGDFKTGTLQTGLIATGGTGTYTWALANGSALPPGLAIRTDTPTFFSTSAQAGIIGVANTPGTYNFSLTVSSGSQTASQAFTMNIHSLVPQENYVPTAYVGQSFTFQFTPVGTVGAVTFTPDSTLPLPNTMSMDSTGKVTGTPSTAGTTSFRFTMTDNNGSIKYTYNFNVSALQFTSSLQLPNSSQGQQNYTATVTATGGTGAITYTSTGNLLPTGLSLNSATGAITGNVASNAGIGPYFITIKATDSATTPNTISKVMLLVVIGVPVTQQRINVGNVDDPVVGDYFSWTICPTSGGSAPFTWSATGLPAGMGVRVGGVGGITTTTGCAELFGPATTVGDSSVTLKMTDANSVATTVTVPLHVSPLNLFSTTSTSGLPDGTLNVGYTSTTLRILGGKASYTSVLTSTGKLPAGITLANNVVSGTPTENGNFSPQFLITDANGATLKKTSSLNVAGGAATTFSINANGTAGYDLGTATVGVSTSFTFSACCIPSYTWTVDANKPAGMTMTTSNNNGVLSGTPTTAGVYTFYVTAADSTNAANASPRQFRLTVTPMAITTISPLPYANANTAYTQTFTVTGGTGTITWAVAPNSYLPPNFTLSNTGVLSGTTTSVGQYFFTVIATDSATTPNTASRSYTLNVYAQGAFPPLNLTTGPNLTYQLGRGTTGLFASGGKPPYTYSPTPGAAAVPGFRVQDGSPLPTGFSSGTTAGFIGVAVTPGVYNTSIRVTDSAPTPSTFDRAITVTILPMTILDQGTLPKATLNVSYNNGAGYQFTPSGGTGAFVFTSTSLPPGMTLSSTGKLTGTPTSSGNFNVSFTLGNAAVTCATGITCTSSFTSTLNVDPFAITTGSTLPQAVNGTTYTTSTPPRPVHRRQQQLRQHLHLEHLERKPARGSFSLRRQNYRHHHLRPADRLHGPGHWHRRHCSEGRQTRSQCGQRNRALGLYQLHHQHHHRQHPGHPTFRGGRYAALRLVSRHGQHPAPRHLHFRYQ